MLRLLPLALSGLVTASLSAMGPYKQHENVVFGETHGIALVMDIFVPTGKKNGLAIVDVASGAWSSSRSKINDHKQAQMFDIYCERGYTVFAVRPGSVSKFTGFEMLAHLQQGIRWVKEHAQEYEIDSNRIGLTGASAGGHLACLAAVSAGDGENAVAAVGVFFPPTDLVNFDGAEPENGSDAKPSKLLLDLAFDGRSTEVSDDQLREMLTKLSPARLITGKEPPFLLIHGDADHIVPLFHSERMIEALQAKGVPAKLIVKPGGAHPWPTIHEEVSLMADWMDAQLKSKE